tara:strand:+ start:219 stop:332 length:114 start_codon:yes stop_codon:yes gene_type:complete
MMDNLKELLMGAAYVSCLIGVVYVTFELVIRAAGVGL